MGPTLPSGASAQQICAESAIDGLFTGKGELQHAHRNAYIRGGFWSHARTAHSMAGRER
jgi:hypothetical protein